MGNPFEMTVVKMPEYEPAFETLPVTGGRTAAQLSDEELKQLCKSRNVPGVTDETTRGQDLRSLASLLDEVVETAKARVENDLAMRAISDFWKVQ